MGTLRNNQHAYWLMRKWPIQEYSGMDQGPRGSSSTQQKQTSDLIHFLHHYYWFFKYKGKTLSTHRSKLGFRKNFYDAILNYISRWRGQIQAAHALLSLAFMNPVRVHQQHSLFVNTHSSFSTGKRNSFIAHNSGSDNLAKDEGTYWVRNSKIPRQNGSCKTRCASMPLIAGVLIQKHIKF